MRHYENLQKTSENRLKARSYYIPEGNGYKLLNGEWKFAFFENGDMACTPEKWDSITVPGCWQRQGYENPNYANIAYPFPIDVPFVPNINPAGVYEREFTVDNTDNNTYFVFEGVASCGELYINGKYVGFTQGSHLFAEFDITDYVVKGTNTVRVYVRKWCVGSYLEDQDQLRYNGIFRDVYILSRPKNHIFDIDIKAENGRIICTADKDFTAEVYFGEQLLGDAQSTEKKAEIEVENPLLWNAEQPNLYTVKIYSAGEIIIRKIGFRTIKISPEYELLINGSPVKLRGVNHHDTNMDKGYTMSEEDILTDLQLMKQLNINCIRTSHYPPTSKFLDFCDEMGFYVVLETDIETHGFCYRTPSRDLGYDDSPEWPSKNPEWEREFVERMQRAYERDKIHSSIIMWSSGNESNYGCNQEAMFRWIKERDSERLCHAEDDWRENKSEYTDVYSRMYPALEELYSLSADENLKKPFYMCEYAHAMGNGPGGIWDYWEAVLGNKKTIGGCIWEWADHVVMVDGVQKYGGDFEGELTHDSNFCCDGMVFANREFRAGTMEIKNTYAPFRIRKEGERIMVKNLFDFNSFADYSFEYNVEVDGVSIEKGSATSAALPGEEFAITPTAAVPHTCALGCYITVRMLDKEGFELGIFQEKLESQKQELPAKVPLEIEGNEFFAFAKGADFEYTVSLQQGNFVSIRKNGCELLHSPSKLTFFRPLTDNDLPMKAKWENTNRAGLALNHIFTKVYKAEISGNRIIFDASCAGVSHGPFFRFKLTYEFFADCSIEVSLEGKIEETAEWLPRLGFEFCLPKSVENFRYFGNGPLQSYADMAHHGAVAMYESSAAAEYVNYVRPQEHGNHIDCRLLELENSLKFTADKMEICVLHHSAEQLHKAEHTDEIGEGKATYVRIDYKDSGIGSAACGPLPFSQYLLSEKDIEFSFTLSV